jgi:hypothetical protein
MTGGTNHEVLQDVLENLTREFGKLPPGSTLRLPLIGTGKARTEQASEQDFRQTIDLMLSRLMPKLLSEDLRIPPRRILLVHPMPYEAQLIATVLAERSIFLTILDKMGLATTDQRVVYGLAYSEHERHRILDSSAFDVAIEHFDAALELMIQGEQTQALKEAARGAEMEPMLGGLYQRIYFLCTKRRGLLEAVSEEAIKLACEGRVDDAYSVGKILNSLGGEEGERRFSNALKRCQVHYHLAELEGQISYEKYVFSRDTISRLCQHLSDHSSPEQALDGFGGDASETDADTQRDHSGVRHNCDRPLLSLQQIDKDLSTHIVNNAYHVIICKLMAEPLETMGVRRILDNLSEIEERGDVNLPADLHEHREAMRELVVELDRQKEKLSNRQLHKFALERLGTHLSSHSTYQQEAAHFHLRGTGSHLISRNDIAQAWQHLQYGHNQHPHDNNILAHIGFIILLQGTRALSFAENFYLLWSKLLERELSCGKYHIPQIETPQGKMITVPMLFPHAKQAYQVQQLWLAHAQDLAKLSSALQRGENGEVLLSQYNKILEGIQAIGHYNLFELHQNLLGQKWIWMYSTRSREGIKISIPMVGEISLNLLINAYRKFKRWWFFRKLKHPDIEKALSKLLESVNKLIQN